MVDWREWAPPIIASIIGSSLIVTALTSAISIMNKPVIDISTTASIPKSGDCAKYTTWQWISYLSAGDCAKYTTVFRNIGHSQASHVRLSLFYPNATIVTNTTKYKNENMTMKEEDPTSLAVFLPRLSSGGHIEIMTTITGSVFKNHQANSNSTNYLGDYGQYSTFYRYMHDNESFSITATYDEGSNAYVPPLLFFIQPHSYFDIQALLILMPAVLGLLAFAIGFRHKRKSVVKFASNVLNDLKKVKSELSSCISSIAIISTHKWDSSSKVRHQFFHNYQYYQIIDNFYKSLEKRDAHLSKTDLSQNDPLTSAEVLKKLREQNTNCLTQAQHACTNIKWTKFYKFDLLSGIPSIVLGSFFITFIAEGIPFFLFWSYPNTPQERWEHFFPFPYFIITSFITRSLIGFVIVGALMHATQGIKNYFLCSFSRSITFLVLSIVILGFPTMTIILYMENLRIMDMSGQSIPFKPVFETLFKPVFDFIFSGSVYRFYLTAMSLVVDVGRMFLLTWAAWAVSKRYATKEVKDEDESNKK